MNTITITMDLDDPRARAIISHLERFNMVRKDDLPTVEDVMEPIVEVAEPAVENSQVKQKQSQKKEKTKNEEVVSEEKTVDPGETSQGPTKLEVRAAALLLSKNGKSAELQKIFQKYGAVNLSTLPEEHYAEAIADMQEVQS